MDLLIDLLTNLISGFIWLLAGTGFNYLHTLKKNLTSLLYLHFLKLK